MNDNVSFCNRCGRWYMDGEHTCAGRSAASLEQRARIADAEARDDAGRPMRYREISRTW
jgi:hypothetical protein